MNQSSAQWVKTVTPEIDVPVAIMSVATKGDTLFAGAYRGTIYRSIDDGLHWKEMRTGLVPSFYEAFTLLILQDKLFAGTTDGVYGSADWGEHWTLFNSGLPSPPSVYTLTKMNDVLVAGTNYGAYYTSDWGSNWLADTTGLPRDYYGTLLPINSIVVADSFLLAGTYNGVYRRNIKGHNWTPANNGIPLNVYSYLRINSLIADGTRIFAATDFCTGSVYFSSDLGNSWTMMSNGMPTNSSGCYLPVYSFAMNRNTLLAGTQYGIYRSSDSGQHWEPYNAGLPLGPASDLYVPCLVSSGGEFLAGTFGGVFRNTDSSESWAPALIQYPGKVRLNALGASGGNLFARASANYWNGTIIRSYRSTNKGEGWDIDTNTAVNRANVITLIGTNLYALGDGMFVSSDNGTNWIEIDAGLPRFGINTLVSNSSTMFAGYGAYFLNDDVGGVYRSTNGGIRWDVVGLEGLPVRSLVLLGTNLVARTQGVYAGNALYRSTDNCTTWTKTDSLLPARVSVGALAASENILFAATNQGVYSSTDAGSTWHEASKGLLQDSAGSYLQVSILYTNEAITSLRGYLFAAIDNRLFMSDNMGTSWQRIDSGLSENEGQLLGITADQSDLFANTDIGIWHVPLSSIITAVGSRREFPLLFRLFQNYPNPFNPSTTISYELPTRSVVTLKIFNVLGEEEATLVNGEVEAGRHQLQWNAGRLASGVYFYRLQAGKAVENRKMILLK